MTTPAIIKAYREKYGVSQEALAARLGVDQATVSRIERGAAPSGPVGKLLERVLAEPFEPKTERAA